jgi:hypothetical protein
VEFADGSVDAGGEAEVVGVENEAGGHGRGLGGVRRVPPAPLPMWGDPGCKRIRFSWLEVSGVQKYKKRQRLSLRSSLQRGSLARAPLGFAPVEKARVVDGLAEDVTEIFCPYLNDTGWGITKLPTTLRQQAS